VRVPGQDIPILGKPDGMAATVDRTPGRAKEEIKARIDIPGRHLDNDNIVMPSSVQPPALRIPLGYSGASVVGYGARIEVSITPDEFSGSTGFGKVASATKSKCRWPVAL
jgi:hypothetical protein